MDKLLTEVEVAREWLNCEPTLLERLRTDGKGPPAVRISERVIRYRPADVQHWLERRTNVERIEGSDSHPELSGCVLATGDTLQSLCLGGSEN